MKALCLALILTGAATQSLAQVSSEEHAAHHPAEVPAAQAAPPAAVKSDAKAPAEAHQKMKAMQALMDQLEKSKDPVERKRLLAQHRHAMQEQLDFMKHMDCRMEMGMMNKGTGTPHQGETGQGAKGHGMMDGGMMKCHEMMQTNMNMTLGMMEQMMRHEDARNAAK